MNHNFPNINPGRKQLFLPLPLWLPLLLLALLLSMAQIRQNQEAMAAKIAPSILRLHILAESDSRQDQQVKLEIRSLLLDYLREHLPADADKDDTILYLKHHRPYIEDAASQYLADCGFDYQATLTITNCYFPTRVYGNLLFPCGYYDAARITLGKGQGHNWWCVLYPRFCLVDEAMEQQETASNSSDSEKKQIQLRFRLFPQVSLTLPLNR